MTRILLAVFLIAHGLVHPAIYATPKDPDKQAPFDPTHSWALSAVHVEQIPARQFSTTIAWLTGALFALGGFLLLSESSAWVGIAVAGAGLGLVLKGLFFHPWLSIGVAIDLATLWAALAGWPASLA